MTEPHALPGHSRCDFDLGDNLALVDLDDPLAHPGSPRLSALTNTGSAPISRKENSPLRYFSMPAAKADSQSPQMPTTSSSCMSATLPLCP